MSSVIKGTIWEDTGPYMMARITGNDGANVTQSDVSSISYVVVDMTDTDTAVASGTLTVASVIYDTLQSGDSRWTEDSTGYNFGFTLAATAFPTGARTYRVDCDFDMATGENLAVVFEIVTKKRFRPS